MGALLPILASPLEIPGASMVMDFVRGQYRGLNPDMLTVTRATTGYSQNQDGLLIPFAAGKPRITNKGLLVEAASTNICLQSEDMSTTWTTAGASGATVTTDATVAPNGTTTADKIVEDTSTNPHRCFQAFAGLADTTSYLFSCYVKPAGRTWIYIRFDDKVPATVRTYFNLTGNAVTVGTTNGTPWVSGGEYVGGGWYRLWIGGTTATGATNPAVIVGAATADATPTYTGDGSSGFYMWGAQLEQKGTPNFPSSYIPTTTASVTRNLDAISVPTGHAFNSWFTNPNAGIWFAAGTSIDNNSGASARRLIDVTDGTASNRFVLALSIANTARYLGSSGGATQWDILSSATFSRSRFSLAGAYATNDFQQATNGVLGSQDSTGTVPTVTQMTIGYDVGGTTGATWDGYIEAIGYIPGDYADEFLKLARLV